MTYRLGLVPNNTRTFIALLTIKTLPKFTRLIENSKPIVQLTNSNAYECCIHPLPLKTRVGLISTFYSEKILNMKTPQNKD